MFLITVCLGFAPFNQQSGTKVHVSNQLSVSMKIALFSPCIAFIGKK